MIARSRKTGRSGRRFPRPHDALTVPGRDDSLTNQARISMTYICNALAAHVGPTVERTRCYSYRR